MNGQHEPKSVRNALDRMPSAGSGEPFSSWMIDYCNAARHHYSPEETQDQLRQVIESRIGQGGSNRHLASIQATVAKAYQDKPAVTHQRRFGRTRSRYQQNPRPFQVRRDNPKQQLTEQQKLENFQHKAKPYAGITDIDLVRLSEQKAIHYDLEEIYTHPHKPKYALVDTLYCRSDKLWLANGFRQSKELQAKQIHSVEDWMYQDMAHTRFFLPNPVTGQPNTKGSYRSGDCIARCPYMVIEHDLATREAQLAFWYWVVKEQVLNVVSLVFTGNKSYHAICATGTTDPNYTQSKIKEVYEHLEPFGFDPQKQNIATLTRLPGAFHDTSRKHSSLVYLNERLAVEVKKRCAGLSAGAQHERL